VLPSGLASVLIFLTTFICFRSTTPMVLSPAFDVLELLHFGNVFDAFDAGCVLYHATTLFVPTSIT